MGEGGTCASLPVVYVAVGRRLGYPLKLVSSFRHQFCRWDEPGGERFNIEVNNHSIDAPADDHYRQGRYHVSPEVERERCYMVSETPKMEVAGFLAQRGYCWDMEKNHKRASEAFLWAAALAPENKLYAYNAKTAMELWREKLMRKEPEGFPQVRIGIPTENRRFPDTIPLDVERHFLCFETKERLLRVPEMQEWCEALRRSNGQRPWWMPGTINTMVPETLWRNEP